MAHDSQFSVRNPVCLGTEILVLTIGLQRGVVGKTTSVRHPEPAAMFGTFQSSLFVHINTYVWQLIYPLAR